MSIRIGNQIVASNTATNLATEEHAGVIRIATDEEVKAGNATNLAITPYQLANAASKTSVDEETIIKDNDDVITAIGVKTKNDVLMYNWIGTSAEYQQAQLLGTIQPDWVCYITDDDEDFDSLIPKYGSDIALLDPIRCTQILEGVDKIGKLMQGSMVLKSEYPEAYSKLIDHKNRSTSEVVTELVDNYIEVTYTKCKNGYKIIDIADKQVYDNLIEEYGCTDFFLLDEVNNLFYLPILYSPDDKSPYYYYYKVGNTLQADAYVDVESQILNLQTRNNIPFTLFECKYSQFKLSNLSWLLSDGQWHSSDRYVAAYNKLNDVYNTPLDGMSVKLHTEEYNDYDFVLNLPDKTFRLPLKTKLAGGKAVVGNGMTLGLTDGVGNNRGLFEGSENVLHASSEYYGVPVNTPSPSGSGSDVTLGITFDPTKSGIETSTEGLYLYFYVGETLQGLNDINLNDLGDILRTIQNLQQKVVELETLINAGGA